MRKFYVVVPVKKFKLKKRLPLRNFKATVEQVKKVGNVVTSTPSNYRAFEKKAKPVVAEAIRRAEATRKNINRAGFQRTFFGRASIYDEKPVDMVKQRVSRMAKKTIYT